MKRVSDYAAQYLEPEDDASEPAPRFTNPRTPPSPVTAWVLQRHEEARRRVVIYARKSWISLARASAAFVVSELPVPHWLGFALFWVAIAFGVATLSYWREFRVARIEASIWPD